MLNFVVAEIPQKGRVLVIGLSEIHKLTKEAVVNMGHDFETMFRDSYTKSSAQGNTNFEHEIFRLAVCQDPSTFDEKSLEQAEALVINLPYSLLRTWVNILHKTHVCN